MEVDWEQNEKLLKALTTNFVTRNFGTRRVAIKEGHRYNLSNPYRKLTVFKIFFNFWYFNFLENNKIMVVSLKEIWLNYVKKPCNKEKISSWQQRSLYCLPFKIYDWIQTRTNFFCSREPFLCKEKCLDSEHLRIPYCFNCVISGNCTNIKGDTQHCKVFDCNACAFEDNLDEICTELSKNSRTILYLK